MSNRFAIPRTAVYCRLSRGWRCCSKALANGCHPHVLVIASVTLALAIFIVFVATMLHHAFCLDAVRSSFHIMLVHNPARYARLVVMASEINLSDARSPRNGFVLALQFPHVAIWHRFAPLHNKVLRDVPVCARAVCICDWGGGRHRCKDDSQRVQSDRTRRPACPATFVSSRGACCDHKLCAIGSNVRVTHLHVHSRD